MSQQGNKTTTRTFRVDEAALKTIEKDARNKKISVNTLVNQLLLAYAYHDRFLEQFPMVKVPSNVLTSLLDGVSDEYAKHAGKHLAENLVHAMTISMQGDLSLNAILAKLRKVSNYGNLFTLDEGESNGNRTITLYHRLGRRGSVWIAECLMSQFESINLQPQITTTELSVAACFRS